MVAENRLFMCFPVAAEKQFLRSFHIWRASGSVLTLKSHLQCFLFLRVFADFINIRKSCAFNSMSTDFKTFSE